MRRMTAGPDHRPKSSTGPSGSGASGFDDCPALIDNAVFLVATRPVAPSPGGECVIPPSLQIGNWRFALNVGKGSAQARVGNVLIIKMAKGALADVLTRPEGWWCPETTLRDAGDGMIEALSRNLVEYVTAAVVRSQQDPLYVPFADRVQDPDWNGVLILNVSLDPSPVEGTEHDIFCAHHLGWEANSVEGEADLGRPASTFGLVDYEVDAVAPGTPSHRLAVLFENAAVKSFDLRG